MKVIKQAISYKSVVGVILISLSLIITFGITKLLDDTKEKPTRTATKAYETEPSTIVNIDNVSYVTLFNSDVINQPATGLKVSPESVLKLLERTRKASRSEDGLGESMVLPGGFTDNAVLARTEKNAKQEKQKDIKHYIFNQRLTSGNTQYPVLGAVARVDLKKDAQMVSFGATIVTDTNVVAGTFSQEDAVKVALDRAAELTDEKNLEICKTSKNNSVIVNKTLLGIKREGVNYLTHEIDVCSKLDPPTFHYRFYISHKDGEVIYRQTQIPHAKDRQIYDCTDFNSTGTCLPPKRLEQGAPVGGEFDRAFDALGDLHDLWQSRFNRDSIDGKGEPLRALLNYDPVDPVTKLPTFCPSAGFSHVTTPLAFFCPTFATRDIVGHEIAHGLTHFTAGLLYQNQSGALNESISDIFGHTLDREDWNLGEDSSAGTVRKMDDPKNGKVAQPDKLYSTDYFCIPAGCDDPNLSGQAQKVCESRQSDYVHINSGILNRAYNLMVDGGTFNGCTIPGIGEDKAIAIIYKALTTRLKPASNFKEAYEAINASCIELHGVDSVECKQVDASMQAVEMDQQPVGTQLAPMCQDPQNRKVEEKPKCEGVTFPTATPPAGGSSTPTPALTFAPGAFCTPPQPGLLDNSKEDVATDAWFTAHKYSDCDRHNSGLWEDLDIDCLIPDSASGPSLADKAKFQDPGGIYYKHFTPADGLELIPRAIILDVLNKIRTGMTINDVRPILEQAVKDVVASNPDKAGQASFDSLYLGIEGGNEGNPVRSASLMVHPLIEREIVAQVGIDKRVDQLFKPYVESFIGKTVPSSDVKELYEAALNKCGAGSVDASQSGLGLMKDFGDYIAIVQSWTQTSSNDIFSAFRDCNIHVVKKVACKASLTGTVTPAVTSGANGTPTPTVDPALVGRLRFNMSLKFQGINRKPVSPRDRANVRVGLFGGSMIRPEYKTFEFISDNNGIWTGRVTFDQPDGDYVVYVKGPSHLQKKIGNLNPTESVAGTYQPGFNKITLNPQVTTLDFSRISQPACDIPGPENPPAGVAKKQDGICNSYDITKVRTSYGVSNDPICDLNRDGTCNTQDHALQLETLVIHFDQE